jgi:hypothetical protein
MTMGIPGLKPLLATTLLSLLLAHAPAQALDIKIATLVPDGTVWMRKCARAPARSASAPAGA